MGAAGQPEARGEGRLAAGARWLPGLVMKLINKLLHKFFRQQGRLRPRLNSKCLQSS